MKRSRIIAALLALVMVLAMAVPAFATEYTVVKGDNLSKIAQKYLGDSKKWKEIYEANKDTIKDPNKISVGQKLTIPDGQPATPPASVSYTPGTYTAEAFGNNGIITVAVTVSATAITKVEVTDHAETPSIGGPAVERIPAAIVANQSLAVDTVTGATNTSTAILEAVADCVKQAGVDAEELQTPVAQNPAEVLTNMTADVLVIGAGGAGMAAAIEAKDQGAGKVILIDKMASIGGTTFTSQGMIGAYDSKLQESMGVELTYEAMKANLMSNASYHLDPALTEITLKNSGATIDWLMERVGLPIEKVIVGYGPLQMMHLVTGGGAAMADPFQETLTKAGVEVLLETRATELVMNADGSVAGAKVTKGGSEAVISAKSVVIATGGYANNPELTAMLTPELAGTWGIGHPASTGDGLVMASKVGALLTHTDDMMCVLKDYEIMSEYNGTSATANNSFKYLNNMIMVGADGKRFFNEKDSGYMSQKLNSPIFDQMHKDGLGYVWCIADKATVEANAAYARTLGLKYISADTPEELAEKLGVPADNLTETINNFNSYVDAGFDAEFRRVATEMGKLESYVAVALVPCEIITYGGIARNDNAEVLRADGTSIPGLYVAGEASANSAYMGFTLTNAFSWGRIAGRNATAYIAGK